MRFLGSLALLLLLLEGTRCQNTRQAKASGKPAKRTPNQGGANVSRPQPAEDDSPVVPRGAAAAAGGGGGGGAVVGAAEAAREAPSGGHAAVQPSEDMRLQFLRNAQVTCNDGTAAG